MASRNTGVNTRDLAVGHEFGFFQSLLNALHGGIDIDYHPALQTIAWSHTHSGEFEFAAGQDFSHDHHYLGRTNV